MTTASGRPPPPMPDLSARAFRRQGNVLVPVDIHAAEWIERLPYGREVLVTIRRRRSPQHHRWFFALLHKVVRATGQWRSEEELLDALKLELGHYEVRRDLFGRGYQAPKSISFTRMDQDEFRLFVERSMDAIALATGIDPEVLMAEVEAEQGSLTGGSSHERPGQQDIRSQRD
jgi:hypothetical protein